MNNINSYQITNKLLNKYNLKANKRYGQNFLIDDNILNEIVEVADITEEDLIIEIGPGLGNLTEYMIKKASYLLLVEIDENMIEVLENRFKENNNYTIISDDILKVNLNDKIEEIKKNTSLKFNNIKVVANLPYYITTPIIFKLLEENNGISDITIMVQKEVAERMVAKPKSKAYGVLTLMVDYLSTANIEIIVPNTSFIPAPDVTSAVIKLKKENKYTIENKKIFFELVRDAFSQRRKKMINSLESCKFNNMDKKSIEEVFNKLNISLNARAEELSINEYINIVNMMK